MITKLETPFRRESGKMERGAEFISRFQLFQTEINDMQVKKKYKINNKYSTIQT